jgi:hypothetical protein
MATPPRPYRKIRRDRLGTALLVRMPEPLITALDGYVMLSAEPISRQEALRRLANLALQQMRSLQQLAAREGEQP